MKIKGIIGIILIIASLAGMYLWETGYRDKLLLTEILVATKDIEAGTVIDKSCYKELSVTANSLTDKVLLVGEEDYLSGKISICSVKANAQLCSDFFISPEDADPEGSFSMVVPSAWIYLKNQSLSPGSSASIYTLPEKTYLGTYKVKRTDPEEDAFVEVQCTLEDYFTMYDLVVSHGENYGSTKCLLLVDGGLV